MVIAAGIGDGKPTSLPTNLTKVSETEHAEDFPILANDGSNYAAWRARMTAILQSKRYGLLYLIATGKIYDGGPLGKLVLLAGESYDGSLSQYFREYDQHNVENDASESIASSSTLKLSSPSTTSLSSSQQFFVPPSPSATSSNPSNPRKGIFNFAGNLKLNENQKEDILLFQTAEAEARAILHRSLTDALVHKIGLEKKANEIWSHLDAIFGASGVYQKLYYNPNQVNF